MQALWQKRYPERKKAKKESSTKQQIPKENSSEPNVQIVDNNGSRKAYYRRYRKVKRATQSQQNQPAIKKKDWERKATQNKNSIASTTLSNPVLQNIQSQIKSPRSYASSIASLIHYATPRKRKALHQNHYIRSCKKQQAAVEELVDRSQGIAKVVKNSSKKAWALHNALNTEISKCKNKSTTAHLPGVNRKPATLSTKYTMLSRWKRL